MKQRKRIVLGVVLSLFLALLFLHTNIELGRLGLLFMAPAVGGLISGYKKGIKEGLESGFLFGVLFILIIVSIAIGSYWLRYAEVLPSDAITRMFLMQVAIIFPIGLISGSIAGTIKPKSKRPARSRKKSNKKIKKINAIGCLFAASIVFCLITTPLAAAGDWDDWWEDVEEWWEETEEDVEEWWEETEEDVEEWWEETEEDVEEWWEETEEDVEEWWEETEEDAEEWWEETEEEIEGWWTDVEEWAEEKQAEVQEYANRIIDEVVEPFERKLVEKWEAESEKISKILAKAQNELEKAKEQYGQDLVNNELVQRDVERISSSIKNIAQSIHTLLEGPTPETSVIEGVKIVEEVEKLKETGAVLAIRVIPMYDYEDGVWKTFDSFARKKIEEIPITKGTDIEKDPVETFTLLAIKEHYWLHARFIPGPDGVPLSIEEAFVEGVCPGEAKEALKQYRAAEAAYLSGDIEGTGEHLQKCLAKVADINDLDPTLDLKITRTFDWAWWELGLTF